jgi:hypothetical protein
MYMRSKNLAGLAVAALLVSAAWPWSASAQQAGPRGPWADPSNAIRVSVAPDVPLSVASKDASQTRVQVQGSLMIIELRCDLTLRNESSQYLRGVTFAVLTDRHAAGGKATVAMPSLNIGPEATFPAKLNLRLIRPLPASADDVIEVDVDGVLLADLTFYGPDRFHSQRRMKVWEIEASRDRRYFKSVLASGGPQQLQSEIAASIDRQLRRPRLEARLAGETLAGALREVRANEEQRIELSSIPLTEAPLEVVSGVSMVEGVTARSPRVTVKNVSPKAVRYFEIGWLVSDPQGRRYTAGAVPSSGAQLPPGAVASTDSQREFVFQVVSDARAAGRLAISGMSGYISQVEFTDGSVWVPPRNSLVNSRLLEVAPVSAEEQRLMGIYENLGLASVVQELSKF